MLHAHTKPNISMHIPHLNPDRDVMDNMFMKRHIKSYKMPGRDEDETMMVMPIRRETARIRMYG